MGSGHVIYISRLIKIGSNTQKLILGGGGERFTDTQAALNSYEFTLTKQLLCS
jgi:hypothetical protein